MPADLSKKDIQNLVIVSVCTVVVAYNFATGGFPWLVSKWRSWRDASKALKDIESKKRNNTQPGSNEISGHRDSSNESNSKIRARPTRSAMFKVSSGNDIEPNNDTINSKNVNHKSKNEKRVRFSNENEELDAPVYELSPTVTTQNFSASHTLTEDDLMSRLANLSGGSPPDKGLRRTTLSKHRRTRSFILNGSLTVSDVDSVQSDSSQQQQEQQTEAVPLYEEDDTLIVVSNNNPSLPLPTSQQKQSVSLSTQDVKLSEPVRVNKRLSKRQPPPLSSTTSTTPTNTSSSTGERSDLMGDIMNDPDFRRDFLEQEMQLDAANNRAGRIAPLPVTITGEGPSTIHQRVPPRHRRQAPSAAAATTISSSPFEESRLIRAQQDMEYRISQTRDQERVTSENKEKMELLQKQKLQEEKEANINLVLEEKQMIALNLRPEPTEGTEGTILLLFQFQSPRTDTPSTVTTHMSSPPPTPATPITRRRRRFYATDSVRTVLDYVESEFLLDLPVSPEMMANQSILVYRAYPWTKLDRSMETQSITEIGIGASEVLRVFLCPHSE